MNKKGELNLSFGMIFSIILIVVFIAFTFFAVKKIIGVQRDVQINSFVQDFQTDVENLYRSSSGSNELTYALPTKVAQVCFENNEDNPKNLVLRGSDDLSIISKEIKYLDLTKILDGKDSFCIKNKEGKINLYIKKEYTDKYVSVLI